MGVFDVEMGRCWRTVVLVAFVAMYVLEVVTVLIVTTVRLRKMNRSLGIVVYRCAYNVQEQVVRDYSYDWFV